MPKRTQSCFAITALSAWLLAGSEFHFLNVKAERVPLQIEGSAASPVMCGTGFDLSRPTVAGDGQVARAEIVPKVLPGSYRGPVNVIFEIMGDHSSITISGAAVAGARTVQRTSSGSIQGRNYSRFDAQVEVDLIGRNFQGAGRDFSSVVAFSASLNGVDYLQGSASAYVAASYVPRSIPSRRVSDTLQYTGHVINIASRVGIENSVTSVLSVPKWFYDVFDDSYDAIVLLQNHLDNDNVQGGRFYGVRNPISGIATSGFFGPPLGVQDITYGSRELQGVIELKSVDDVVLLHEMAHQWGDRWNWQQLVGINSPDGPHPPLWGSFESPLSYRLYYDQVLSRNGDSWLVSVDPAPTFSPLDLYAMGRLDAGDFPHMEILLDPNQRPSVGWRASGPSTRITLDDIVRVHGRRIGPVVERWRTAIVVVSVDRLLSHEELAFYDYFGLRVSDPAGLEILDPTFQKMTGIPLDTRIYPRDAEPVPSYSYPPPVYRGRDFGQYILLDSDLPAVWNRGELLSIRGSVVNLGVGSGGYRNIRVRLDRSDRTVAYTSVPVDINSSGAFLLPIDSRSIPPGRYEVAFEFSQTTTWQNIAAGRLRKVAVR